MVSEFAEVMVGDVGVVDSSPILRIALLSPAALVSVPVGRADDGTEEVEARTAVALMILVDVAPPPVASCGVLLAAENAPNIWK